MKRGLGRRVPDDWTHVDSFPFSAVSPGTVSVAEEFLELPGWHWTHDQGYEGSCVGHAAAMERAIMNTAERKAEGRNPYTVRYNPLWIWNHAKEIDEWEDTNPGDDEGTSVNAGYKILRTLGAPRVYSMRLGEEGKPYAVGEKEVKRNAGVRTNRWAETVDEMRTAITLGSPVSIGVDWYSSFDDPEPVNNEYWIGRSYMGASRGGHAVCIYAVSDSRQAFKIKNSWGTDYPLVWLPYTVMEQLLEDYGEATLQTDRDRV